MDIGATLPTGRTDEHAVPPGAVRSWATGAEDRGFAGLWVLDRLLEPDTCATSVLTAPVALAHAAGVTDTVPLGTSMGVYRSGQSLSIVHPFTSCWQCG